MEDEQEPAKGGFLFVSDLDLGTGKHICKYCATGKAPIKIRASCWHGEYYSTCQHEARIKGSRLADEQLMH